MLSYGTWSYASGSALAILSQDDIAINGYWIQNEYIRTFDFDDGNDLDIKTYDLPRRDWRGLLWYYKRGRNIKFWIYIKGDDAEDFQTRLDELRKNLFQEEVYLDKRVNGVIRRIKVECVSNPLNFKHYNSTFLRTEINLIAVEPFWYEIGYEAHEFTSKTASFTSTIENGGTDVADPIVTILFKTGLSGVTSSAFAIWDNEVTLTASISDNDVLEFNSETKEVLLNGVSQDYDEGSVFPEMGLDTNIVEFTINWTWTADIVILNKKNYV